MGMHACHALSSNASLWCVSAHTPPNTAPGFEQGVSPPSLMQARGKPAANGYYEVVMSPETVLVKMTLSADEEVAVTLSVEVSCTQPPCSAHLNPAQPFLETGSWPWSAGSKMLVGVGGGMWDGADSLSDQGVSIWGVQAVAFPSLAGKQ